MQYLWFLTQKYKLKAIHNCVTSSFFSYFLVIPHAKIQIESNSQQYKSCSRIFSSCDSSRKNTNWKQFTTVRRPCYRHPLLWFLTQKYKLKAIHNENAFGKEFTDLVIPHAKIQIESNSQPRLYVGVICVTCDSSRKNTNWKQFTTILWYIPHTLDLWFLTQKYKLKAIHNHAILLI